jgi:phosphoglycolate phosphatase
MSLPVAYTHYVFDLDGTLVDSIPGIDSAARAALAGLSPGQPLPSLRTFIGPPIRVMLQRALRWTDDARLDALERAFRIHYDGGAWKETTAYGGVGNTLRQLHARGAKLHVLTNKPPVPTARILDHLGWTPLFTAIVSPQSRTPPYPDKTAAALDLRERLGLPPAATLLVGDSPDDAAAARAAGFGFSAAAWGYGEAAVNNPARALASFSDIIHLSPYTTHEDAHDPA